MNNILEIKNLKRSYKTQAGVLEVLKGVNLSIKSGEIIGLIGPSGSGKSSLLHSAGLLEEWQDGEIYIIGEKVSQNDEKKRTNLRLNNIGFVYQFHNLLPEFTALDNVALPMMIAGNSFDKSRKRAEELLKKLGLSHRMDHMPSQLSGGEQQRVAIGRALSNSPKLIIADEPTGNLDPNTSQLIFDIFVEITRNENVCALVATHNHELAAKMDRILKLNNCLIEN